MESKITITSTSKGVATARELQPSKRLWDWLELLATLAIPVVVGLGAAWLTTKQAQTSVRENIDNQREGALQASIDKISQIVLNGNLRYKQIRCLARLCV